MSARCPAALAQPIPTRRRTTGPLLTTPCRWGPPPAYGALARNTSPRLMPPPHQHRAGERHARSQTLPVVERDRTAVLAAGEARGARAPLRWRPSRRAARRRRERRAWEAGGGDHTAVDQVARRRRRQRTRA